MNHIWCLGFSIVSNFHFLNFNVFLGVCNQFVCNLVHLCIFCLGLNKSKEMRVPVELDDLCTTKQDALRFEMTNLSPICLVFSILEVDMIKCAQL